MQMYKHANDFYFKNGDFSHNILGFLFFSCHLVFSTFVFVASFESQVVGMLLACPIRHVQE